MSYSIILVDEYGSPVLDLSSLEPWVHYIQLEDGVKFPLTRIIYSFKGITLEW